MKRRLALFAALLLIAACQSDRVDRDFDPVRDYSVYRTWSWKEPGVQYRPDDPRVSSDLIEQRIRQAIGDELEQRGLRQASKGTAGNLQVQAWYIVEKRQQQITTNYGGGWWGYPWGGYWGGGPGYNESRTQEYRIGIVQIDLYDGRDSKLVWRGSSEHDLSDGLSSPGERTTAMYKTIYDILSHYPPY
ncbi:DUF4136 domain-containing protein [Azomonas macrocytogenes]|uniref:DUF4136 domain-containing protein n=1 Tax=Azomonas macrocytogenes TaxID=69962 RepID=A0A839SZF1_AZOMA|nr:DUF4136 domain-containing protein [Azomonas macrocytogenes]MBB3102069.1 hypothetical protein [Azomonas macrocytogenes]